MYILDVCGSSGILKIFAFLKIILNFIFIIVPIGLIVMVSFDFAKAVTSSGDKANKEALTMLVKRLIIGIIIFLLP